MLEMLIDRDAYLGSGISREAYRSVIPGYVIKKDYTSYSSQQEGERRLFEQMTLDEKEVFPIVAIEGPYTMMKECKPLDELGGEFVDLPEDSSEIEDEDFMREFFEKNGLNVDSLDRFYAFVEKYDIRDLHDGNVALLNNNLVIIDAGSNSSNGHEIWGGSEYSSEYSEEEEYSTDCSYS